MRKITKLILALAALLLGSATSVYAGDKDDFGIWTEAEVEKKLPYNLSLNLGGEMRTEDMSSRIDRLSAGVGLSYKVNKYFKLSASYNLMGAYSPEKRKEHYKEHDDGTWKLDANGNPIWNGYKITDHYWTPRHRLNIEATTGIKLNKWLRISLRERYQYTHNSGRHVDVTKHRFDQIMDGEGNLSYVPRIEDEDGDGINDWPKEEIDYKAGSDNHILRSRLKLEVDKKKLAWSPFISIESHNNLTAQHGNKQTNVLYLEKVRTMVGTGYKINKKHAVSMAYVLTFEHEINTFERMHAISIGYNYDF